jgi:hypothetical protein
MKKHPNFDVIICAAEGRELEGYHTTQERWVRLGTHSLNYAVAQKYTKFRVYEKHREIREAYAEGKRIEWYDSSFNKWREVFQHGDMMFHDHIQYRIAEVKDTDKFAELKKAFRDGAVIEWYSDITKEWCVATTPLWDPRVYYRVKTNPTPMSDHGLLMRMQELLDELKRRTDTF